MRKPWRQSEQHYKLLDIMASDFFRLRPIEWVDLPYTTFDDLDERVVSEAVLPCPHLDLSVTIRERRNGDHPPTFHVVIRHSYIRGDIDSVDIAKQYAAEVLHSNLSMIITPSEVLGGNID